MPRISSRWDDGSRTTMALRWRLVGWLVGGRSRQHRAESWRSQRTHLSNRQAKKKTLQDDFAPFLRVKRHQRHGCGRGWQKGRCACSRCACSLVVRARVRCVLPGQPRYLAVALLVSCFGPPVANLSQCVWCGENDRTKHPPKRECPIWKELPRYSVVLGATALAGKRQACRTHGPCPSSNWPVGAAGSVPVRHPGNHAATGIGEHRIFVLGESAA